MSQRVDHPLQESLPRLEQTLRRLALSAEALGKDWAKNASDGDARPRAPLVRAILGAVQDGAELSPDESARLVDLVAGEASQPAALFDELIALQLLLTRALHRGLLGSDPSHFEEGLRRLTRVLGAVQIAAADRLWRERSEGLERLVHTDPLTGLFNRRYLAPELARLLALERRYGTPFAVLLLDVDDLKQINDAYGHEAGDAALIGLARVLRVESRESDAAIRLGGDEFCLLAPHQSSAGAVNLAERLTAAVRDVAVAGGRLSASIGAAVCPDHGREAGALLKAADRAMYSGKTKRLTPSTPSPTPANRRLGKQ